MKDTYRVSGQLEMFLHKTDKNKKGFICKELMKIFAVKWIHITLVDCTEKPNKITEPTKKSGSDA